MTNLSSYKYFFLTLLFILITGVSFGQSKKQRALEKQRQEILKEISQINTLLSASNKEKKSLLTQIEDLNLKIKVRQNLIRVTNQQANLLTREIKQNRKQIMQLEADLAARKKDYAKVVVNSYKNKSKQSNLLFLLSSKDFLQAYKRYNYMKQYKEFQKKLADSIASKTKKLHLLNASLLTQKEDKKKLISENIIAKKALVKEQKNQKIIVENIQKDSRKYKKIIAKKQKESDALDKKIDKLIREAIAKSNKKHGKSKNTKTFALTAEAKKLAAKFVANKRKLPWPVKQGRVTKHFGKQRHPVLPGIYTHSSGVEITTPKNSRVRAVFNGTVTAVMKVRGSLQGVFIKHGNYTSVYFQLKEVFVKKGDHVTTKQDIGIVGSNLEGKNVLKFMIYKDNIKLNPVQWIYKMR